LRNLLGRLHDRSGHDLDLIARWWEIDLRAREHAAAVAHLYRVLIDAWSYALAWERLSPTDRVVLDLLVDDEGAFTEAEIAERLGAPVSSVEPSVRRLYRAGFLFAEQDEPVLPGIESRYFLPREIAHLTANLRREQERGLPVNESAAALLDRLSDGALVDIAERMGRQIIPALALRADLMAYIEPRLGDPKQLREAVRALNPGAARLWRWLLDHPEPPTPGEARAALGIDGSELRRAVQSLAEHGLLWRGYASGDQGERGPTLRLVVPDLLRHPRGRQEPPPPELREVDGTEIPAADWISPYAAPWDLLTVLRALAAGQLRPSAVAESNSPAMRRLASFFWRRSGDLPPTGYVAFLGFLATGLGLLRPEASGVALERVREWTGLDFPEQLRRMVEVWRQSSAWPEGESKEALQVWGADWPGFRSRLLSALTQLEPGTWVTLDSFSARLAAAAPDALGAHFTAAASHEEPDRRPEGRRLAVVRLAIELTLTTAAEWLGLIAVAKVGRETVLTPTELSQAIANGRQPPPLEVLAPHSLVVQPDFEALLLQPSPRRIWALSAFTQPVSLDRVSSYRITRQSIERGLSAGLALVQMTGFLEQHAGEPLPQNVAFEIETWAREFRKVRIRESLLIEPDDRASVATITEDLRGAGLRFELLPGDRLLVLMPDGADWDQMRRSIEERLRALGQTPLRRGS
jgi:predicted transcriptional regulator